MDLQSLLGDDADDLLAHTCKGVPRDQLTLPGADFLDRVITATDRSPQVLRGLGSLYGHGRLAGTGYVSILPVDQGIEHSGGGVVRAQSGVLRSRPTSSSWRSRAGATPSPPRSACSAR